MSREKQDDDLRWLTSPWLSNLDPTEKVGNTTESSHQVVQSTPLPVLSDHLSHLEGIVDDNIIVDTLTEEVVAEDIDTGDHECQGGDKASYVLPPRTPLRYDPDYDARRSRYPIEQPDGGNMS